MVDTRCSNPLTTILQTDERVDKWILPYDGTASHFSTIIGVDECLKMLDHRTRQLSTASIPEKFEISDYCWNNLDLYFLLKNDEEGRYSIKQWDTSAKGYADGLYELTNWEGERGKDFSILRIFNEELYLGTKQGALFTF